MLFLNNKNKTIYNHIADLKKVFLSIILIWLFFFVGCFYFAKELLELLQQPIILVLNKYSVQNYFITTSTTEVFFANIKQAFYFSLFIALPFICIMIFFYIIGVLHRCSCPVY